MRITVQKQVLQNALQTVAKAVPSRTTKPILYNVLLEARENRLILTGYDLEFGIEVSIQADPANEVPMLQIEGTGAIALNARYLNEIVRKLPHPLVRIHVSDLVVTLQSGHATFTLNAMDPREYPSRPDVHDDRGFSVSAETLRELIDRTAFAISTSEARPVLTGVLWHYANGYLGLGATDSHRMATYKTEVETRQDYALMEAIIPGKTLQELARTLPQDDTLVSVRIEEQQLLVEFQHTRCFTRLIDGKFPDLSRIIPQTFKTTVILDIETFQNCVERAAVLARDTENQIIRLHLRTENLEISSHSPEIGKITETVDLEDFQGEAMVLACNARFLLDALKATPGSKVRLEFTGPGSSFVMTPVTSEQHFQLMQPVRQIYL